MIGFMIGWLVQSGTATWSPSGGIKLLCHFAPTVAQKFQKMFKSKFMCCVNMFEFARARAIT